MYNTPSVVVKRCADRTANGGKEFLKSLFVDPAFDRNDSASIGIRSGTLLA
jgi:hypothetical protein